MISSKSMVDWSFDLHFVIKKKKKTIIDKNQYKQSIYRLTFTFG